MTNKNDSQSNLNNLINLRSLGIAFIGGAAGLSLYAAQLPKIGVTPTSPGTVSGETSEKNPRNSFNANGSPELAAAAPDAAIMLLQANLKTIGFDTGDAPTGFMDDGTRAALDLYKQITNSNAGTQEALMQEITTAADTAKRDLRLFTGITAKVDENLTAATLFAIRNASSRTGMDYATMLKKAEMESEFDPTVPALGTACLGLYQVEPATWITLINRQGDEIGLGELQAKLKRSEPGAREEALALRTDARYAAMLAGWLAKENEMLLRASAPDRQVGGAILYLGHWAGTPRARLFLAKLAATPEQNAAEVLTKEAAEPGNHHVFYVGSGKDRPRSFAQIYARFVDKLEENNVYQTRLERAAARPKADKRRPR